MGRELWIYRHVSIHAPARGATRRINAIALHCSSFNPRARKGRDHATANRAKRHHVSIHAPARGATYRGIDTERRIRVSIHAPARGATKLRDELTRVTVVSIHAPARGATTRDKTTGRDSLFQSTRPQGARRRATRRPDATACFNPRARKGRDPTGAPDPVEAAKFQSTRPQGARPTAGRDHRRRLHVSIHAPARGATSLRPIGYVIH